MSWLDLYRETTASIASILWGLAAVVALMVFAIWQGSVLGAGLTVLTAGTTYVFQELQRHYEGKAIKLLMFAPMILWLWAFLAIVIGV